MWNVSHLLRQTDYTWTYYYILLNFLHKVYIFCYDNELPVSETQLDPFKIYSFVTNGEWKEFINDDGYKNHEYWLSDGWDFVNNNKLEKPMYWIDNNNYFTLNGVKKIDNEKPVSHISFYEADAFARYKNKRLPTEFEL